MSSQDTSLQQAVSAGDTNAVRTVIAGGADVNAPNSSGQTPIVLAIVTAQYHLLPLLLSAGANPSLRDNTGLSAFDWAERKGRSDLAQSLGKDSGSEYPAQVVAREETKHKTIKSSTDEAPRATSADEKSRRFVAGLKQRFEEKKAKGQATNDHFQSIEEELFAARPLVSSQVVSSQEFAPRKEEKRLEEKKADQMTSGSQSADVRSETPDSHGAPTVQPSARDERITTNINREEPPRPSTDVRSQTPDSHGAPTVQPSAREERITTNINREEPPRPSTDARSQTPDSHRTPTVQPSAHEERIPTNINREEPPRPSTDVRSQTPGSQQSATVQPSARQERITTNIHREEQPRRSTKVALQNSPVPVPVAARVENTTRSSSSRKRCPKCGRTYNNELLAYCAYHEVALVDADAPVVTEPPPNNKSHLLLILVIIAAASGALAGFLLIDRLFPAPKPVTPAPAQQPQPPVTQKGTPELNKRLEGKAISLPEAEVPANTVKEPTTISVQIKIGSDGVVKEARCTTRNHVLMDAALTAARKATFSVDKLGRRRAEGTISYTFK